MVEAVEFVASIATAGGIILGVVALWLTRSQSQTVFEQSYIDRYWVIVDDMAREQFNVVAPGNIRLFEYRYLRLCEDEFELRKLKRIRRRTWRVWHDAMTAASRSLLPALDRSPDAWGSLDPRFEYVRHCFGQAQVERQNGHKAHDAKRCTAFDHVLLEPLD